MATAQVVYAHGGGRDAGLQGQLFAGKTFWLAQRVPSRNRYVDDIRNNGGQVVPLEDQADILIADDVKKNVTPPPGSLKFTFIDDSIRKGELANPENYRIGPTVSVIREIGSTSKPARARRVPFTAEDDRILTNWVLEYERRGGKALGNTIYQHLEEQNPRHTFQSWRDRWVKYLSHRPRPAQASRDAPVTPPSDPQDEVEIPETSRPVSNRSIENLDKTAASKNKFTQEEARELLEHAEYILSLNAADYLDGWVKMANGRQRHTAEELRAFFETKIRPIYEAHAPKDETESARGGISRDPERGKDSPAETGAENSESPVFVPQSPSHQWTSKEPPQAIRQAFDDPRYKFGESSTAALMYPKDTPSPASEDPPPNWVVGSKRKRAVMEEDDGLVEKQLRAEARLRLSTEGRDFEIPSTPQRSIEDDDDLSRPSGNSASASPSHSAAYIAPQDTQSIVEDMSTQADLAIPSPTGGWGRYEEMDDESAQSETLRARVDTQALLEAETQALDLELPAPDGGWAAHSISSSDQPDQTAHPDALDSWIDAQIAAGYNEGDIITSLKCTTMLPSLAQEVLASIKYGNGIPSDVRGIWTAEDDEDLSSTDGRVIRLLQEKHGRDSFTDRWNFLRSYEDASV